jgi:hypothetical protein
MKNISSSFYYTLEKKLGTKFNPYGDLDIFLEFDGTLFWDIAVLLANGNSIKVLRTSIKDQLTIN